MEFEHIFVIFRSPLHSFSIIVTFSSPPPPPPSPLLSSRGLIMGIWFMNVSVGNILGTVIPSFWAYVDEGNPENMAPWGWAFIVPGLIIATVGIVVFLFLVSGKRGVSGVACGLSC